MKSIKKMPFVSVLDDQRLEVVIWQTEPGDVVCEFADGQLGACDTSGIGYGTVNEYEPTFCARHFYQQIVAGDGISNYALIDETDERVNKNSAPA